jgi:hypothetical protein
VDERGREVLSYLEGECGAYPLQAHWVTDDALTAVATMLRRFHDAQFGFRPATGAVWRSFGPPPPGTEVICHHDAAPHNVIWRPDDTLAMIDFDLPRPGRASTTSAYAAWTWVPVFSDRDSSRSAGTPRPAAPAAPLRRRVRPHPARPAPAGGHHPGPDRGPRGGHPAHGRRGEPAFVRIVHKGHLRRPMRDLRLIDHERAALETALR